MKKIFFALLFLSYWSFGQQLTDTSPANYQSKVGIRARVSNNQVMLRWAPLSPALWKTGNANGYTITRKTLNTSGSVIATTSYVVSKKPAADWTSKIDSSFYDIIYDALYDAVGSAADPTVLTNTKTKLDAVKTDLNTLEREINNYRQSKGDSNKAALTFYTIGTVTSTTVGLYQASVQSNYLLAYKSLGYFKTWFNNKKPKPADSTAIRTKIAEFDLRMSSVGDQVASVDKQYTDDDVLYGFSMMAADMKYGAAKMAGLGFVDANVTAGQKYRYIIKVNGTGGARVAAGPNDPIVTGIDSLEINANFTALPVPTKPNLVFKDGKVEAKWNFNAFKEYYGSYYVERKESGAPSYTRLTAEPFTKFDSSSDSLFYTDSLPNIKKTFLYRIVGVSYFDELVSSVDNSVQSSKFYYASPDIKGYKPNTSTTYRLNWQFLKNPLVDSTTLFPLDSISSYKILVSRQSDSAYAVLKSNISKSLTSLDLLKTEIRAAVDTSKSYYVRLVAITLDNDELSSLPFIVVPRNKTPPAKPTNLTAVAEATPATTLDAIKNTLNTLERAINTYRTSKGDSNKTALTYTPTTPADVYMAVIHKNFYTTYKRLGYFKAYYDAKTPVPADAATVQAQISAYYKSLNDVTVSINNYNNFLVRVSWNANTEADLLGYQVFRKIGQEMEKTEVSGGIRKPVFLLDTLNKKMSYPSIKYYVVAFDSMYNHSDTATVVYTKPDTRAPIAPRIIGYTVSGVDVTLNFQLSPDTDIDKYYVWRKELGVVGSETQINLFTPADNKTSYKDAGLGNGKTYIYWIYARDLSGNESCYDPVSNPKECFQLVPVKVVSTKRSPVTVFTGTFDLDTFSAKLDWAYTVTDEVESFEMYRGDDSLSTPGTQITKFTLWKTLGKDEITTTDYELKDNHKYTYGIRVTYKDGTISPMTTVIVYTPNREACTSGQMQLIKTSVIQISANPIIDRACYEIILDEGFETVDGVDYTAEIGNN